MRDKILFFIVPVHTNNGFGDEERRYMRFKVAIVDRLSSYLVQTFLSAIPWTSSLAKLIQ